MKTIKLNILFLLITHLGFSQALKSYSGEYPSEVGGKGMATYTYYEDPITHDYIKHGQFKFTIKQDAIYNAVFTGNFKNGKRDGIWNYNITCIDNPANNVFYTGTIKSSTNYSNGLPNGKWTFSKNMKYRGKTFTLKGYIWTNYEIQPNVTVDVTYKNGVTIDNLRIINDDVRFTTIDGNFDKNGFLDKIWIWKGQRSEITRTFKNGILISTIIRNLPNGNVQENSFDNAEMTNLKNDFLENKISTVDLLKRRISIDTFNAVRDQMYSFSSTIYSDYLNFANIGGDDVYMQQRNKYNDGYYFTFIKAEIKQLSEIDDYKTLKNRYNFNFSNYEDAILDYETFISDYKLNLSNEDIEILNAEIDSFKKHRVIALRKEEYKEIENISTYNKDYLQCIEKSNQYLEDNKGILTKEELEKVNAVIQSCTNQIQNIKDDDKRKSVYANKMKLEESLRQSDISLSYKYDVGHASEKFPIYEIYKKINERFENEKKMISTNGSDINIKNDQLIILLQDFNYIVDFIRKSPKPRISNKLQKDIKASKNVKEIREKIETFK